MTERRYKGHTIVARLAELQAAKGWSAEYEIRIDDGEGVTTTRFGVTGIFATKEKAIEAVFACGQLRIDEGFQARD